MKRRHHAITVGAVLSWSERRSSVARARANRPGVDRLESRCLLATVAEFGVPSGSGAAPDGVTAGPGNSVWFTEYAADKIGTIDPVTHTVSEFKLPTANAEPFRITLGPDGNLWFTENGAGQIGMINPTTDKITEYPLSDPNAQPFGITAGPNDTVWFTEWSSNKIGSIDAQTGKINEYTIPTLNSVPEGITLGSDGNIWFAESQGNQITMFDPTSGKFAEHALPTAAAEPYGITTGPGGNLYFTEYTGNKIGVYSVSGSTFLTSINIPTAYTQPTEITVGLNGQLWFTQSKTNQVGVFNTATGAITEFATPSFQSGPRGIAAASDGSIWFSELDSGNMGTIASSLQLVVTSSPPLDLNLGESFGLSVAVESGAGGPIDSGYDGSVTLSIVSATAAGSPVVTSTATAAHGVASFSGLSLNHPGSYSIEIKTGSLAPISIGPITVAGPTGPSPVGPPVSPPVSPPGSLPVGPVVLGEQLVMAGKGKNRYVAGIVLTFSSALDPATARNASNYTVVQTTAARTKVVKPIRLHAAYRPGNNKVKLSLAGKPRFTAGGQLLVVASGPTGVSSATGVSLEGNTGDTPGANAVFMILPRARGISI